MFIGCEYQEADKVVNKAETHGSLMNLVFK